MAAVALRVAPDAVPVERDFMELGLDSIVMMNLLVELTNRFELTVYPHELFDRPNIRELARYLAEEIPASAARVAAARGESVDVAQEESPHAQAEPLVAGAPASKSLFEQTALPTKPATRNGPAAFLISSPRSGSTLLRVMLAGHPDLFCPPELHLLPFSTMSHRHKKLSSSYLGEGLQRALMELMGFDADTVGAMLEQLEQQDAPVQDVYAMLQESAAPRLLVDKSPSYAFDLATLERAEDLFDRAKYVFLIRHPYSTIESLVRNRIHKLLGSDEADPFAFAEGVWTKTNSNMMTFLERVESSRQYLLRYEDLVRDPQKTAYELCEFLEIPFNEALLNPYEGERMTDGVHKQSMGIGDPNFLKRKEIEPSLGEVWKTLALPSPLGEEAKNLAARLGYELPQEARKRPAARPGGAPAEEQPRPEQAVSAARASSAMEDVFARSNLTTAQLAIWYAQKLYPDSPFFNMAIITRLPEDMDLETFKAAFQALVDRADALRMAFCEEDGVPLFRVLPGCPAETRTVDFSDESDPLAAAESWAEDRLLLPLNLDRRAFESAILTLGDGRHLWYLNQHHLICDGISVDSVINLVQEYYRLLRENRMEEAAPLPQYAAFAEHERGLRKSQAALDSQQYWAKKLAEPVEPILFYGGPTERDSTETARVHCDLGVARTERLLTLARDKRFRFRASTEHASMFNVLTGLLFAYLHRISGNRVLAAGVMQHNRRHPAFRDTIGIFVGASPIRIGVAPDETFESIIAKVRHEMLETRRHSRGVVMAGRQGRDYDVLINYQVGSLSDALGAPFETKWIYTGQGVETLGFQVLNAKDTGRIRLHFDLHCDVFSPEQRTQVRDHYMNMLDSFLADPSQRIGEVALLGAKEPARVLIDANRPDQPPSQHKTADEVVEQVVGAQPERVAVQNETAALSYLELDRKANQLAHYLQAQGVGPEMVVAVCMDRCLDVVVAILGVLKAGGAYLPLDPMYPRERLEYMVADSRARVILTQVALQDLLTNVDSRIVCLDDEQTAMGAYPATRPGHNASAGSPAYVIYTSGSTGRPKGTIIEHRGLCNLIPALIQPFGLTHEDRVLQFSSPSFDASVLEIFTALGSGARLCVASQDTLKSPSELAAFIQRNEVSFALFPPTMLRMLDPGDVPSLRTVVSGGERCPEEVCATWAPACRFINGYGPTENTVAATLHHCEEGREEAPPIGTPIANVRAYVLDRYLQPVPIGVVGELYIGGAGLARGYLGRPELTAEAFVPSPFADAPGARLYRTGDLVRYRQDHTLAFVGRRDDQVKVYGYRIELGEIVAALEEQEGVAAAEVVPRSNTDGACSLTAYIVRDGGSTVTPDGLRDSLGLRLPHYMLPHEFLFLEAFPLTPSGKVDRRSLPVPEPADAEPDRVCVPPRTDAERLLARVWRDVLDRDGFGIHDDFFELGGDSLAAIRAVEMAKAEGLALRPTQFYASPTIGAMAAIAEPAARAPRKIEPRTIMHEGAPLDIRQVVVPIVASGTKHPLYCVAPAGGVVFPYYNLASYLGDERPIYGLQDPGLARGHKPFESVEELAAYYIEAMKLVQPEGPYLLGGWSFGGTVAFEMACQLHASGDRVGMVALMDTGGLTRGLGRILTLRNLPQLVVGAMKYSGWALRNIIPYLRDALYVLNESRKREKRDKGKPTLREYMGWIGMNAMHRFFVRAADVAEVVHDNSQLLSVRQPAVYPILRVNNANIRALRRYTPGVYPGRLTLFRAEEQPLRLSAQTDPTLGWGEYAGDGVDIRDIPGNHVVMFRKPYIKGFAAALRTALDETDADH